MAGLSDRNQQYGERRRSFAGVGNTGQAPMSEEERADRRRNTTRGGLPTRDPRPFTSTGNNNNQSARSRQQRRASQQAPRAISGPARPRGFGLGFSGGGGSFGPAVEEESLELPPMPEFGRSLEDYLSNARIQELIAQIGGGYDNRMADVQRQGQRGDAAIAGIYDGLVQNIRGADAQFEDIGNDALAQTKQNTDNAAAAAAQSGNAASANLNTTLANLGISDAPVGDQLARASQDAGGVIGERGQIASQYLTDDTKNEREFNQSTANAAGFTGASMRAGLQSDLQSALARLADERARAVTQGRSQMFDMARNMYDADYGQWRDSQAFGLGLDDRAWDRAQQASEFDLRRQQLMAELSPQAYEPETGYEQSAMRMQMQQLPPQAINQIMATFNSIPYDATKDPVRYAQQVEQALRAAGLDERSIAVARQEAMEYFQAYRN